MGLSFLTSCAPEPKNADTTKDSGAKSSDSTVTDLDTDELTQTIFYRLSFHSMASIILISGGRMKPILAMRK